MMKRHAALFTFFVLAIPFFTLGWQFVSQAAQRVDSKIRKMTKHELNMDLAEERLKAKFKDARVHYPPAHTTLVFFKDSKELLVYAGEQEDRQQLIHRYPVTAASGTIGPKLKEGDQQVPEGIYKIMLLNPKSAYHLSLRVNYPNEWDRAQAKKEKRSRLGGDIMIHGEAVSIGCIAIGNVAIEEVYRLAEKTDFKKWGVLLSPIDFRSKKLPAGHTPNPPWMADVYRELEAKLLALP